MPIRYATTNYGFLGNYKPQSFKYQQREASVNTTKNSIFSIQLWSLPTVKFYSNKILQFFTGGGVPVNTGSPV